MIQTVKEVEMDKELGRERCQRAVKSGGTPNYRNSHAKKTVKTQLGKVEIQIRRDRNGSFEPKIIGKHSRNADGMEEKILSLYSFMDAIHYKVKEEHRYVTKAPM